MATIDMFYPPLPAIITGTPRARILAALATELDMAGIAHRTQLPVSDVYGVLGSLLRDGLVRVRDDRRGYAQYRGAG